MGVVLKGFEYVFKDAVLPNKEDTVLDYKFSFVVDQLSQPYLNGMTLDYVTEGLNEYFKFMNPNEISACGCEVSVQFEKQVVQKQKVIRTTTVVCKSISRKVRRRF